MVGRSYALDRVEEAWKVERTWERGLRIGSSHTASESGRKALHRPPGGVPSSSDAAGREAWSPIIEFGLPA